MAGTANRIIILARLSREPEKRNFPNGGGVVALGLVVDERKKNPQSGQYEDSPVFIDADAFVSAEGKGPGSVVERFAKKGQRLYLEGHLSLDQWDDKATGQKRSKLKVIVDHVVLIEPKAAEPRREEVPTESPVEDLSSEMLPF